MFRDQNQLAVARNFPVSPEPSDRGRLKQGPMAPVPAIVPKEPGQSQKPDTAGNKPRRGVRAILFPATIAAALAGGYFGGHWWVVGRFQVSTDDAYVGAHTATLAAKIPGYIATIPVEDNQHLRAGDVIATIDDGDYRLAVDAARDKAATQKATIERIGQQVAAQQAVVQQAIAQVASAQAGATQAQLELDRQQALANREWASRQKLEQAQANRDQTAAAVRSAQAQLQSAAANVDVLKGQQEEAEGARDLARQG